MNIYRVFFKAGITVKAPWTMLLQAITIADQRYDSYRKCDFISALYFPRGCLPSVSQMVGHIAKQTDMVVWSLQ